MKSTRFHPSCLFTYSVYFSVCQVLANGAVSLAAAVNRISATATRTGWTVRHRYPPVSNSHRPLEYILYLSGDENERHYPLKNKK